MKQKSILLLFAMLILSTSAILAQQTLSLGLGATYYRGDMKQTLETTRPGIAFHYTSYFSPHFAGRLSAFYSGYGAADSLVGNEARNLHFRSSLWEVSGRIVYDIIGTKNRTKRSNKFSSPYLWTGIAIFGFDPQAKLRGSDDWYSLKPLGTEGQYILKTGYPKPYRLVQFAIPAGLGMYFKMNDYWGMDFEAGYRYTFTDYMDDVSGVYPVKNELLAFSGDNAVIFSDPSKELHAAGVSRGNTKGNDSYVFASLCLSYYLQGSRSCPTFGAKKK
jgi:hypothetical protein